MPDVKTITLDGGEIAVKFPQSHPHYIITNLGDNEIYASADSGIAPNADGVIYVPAGTETYITPKQGNTVYLYGTGRVQIRGWEFAVPPSPSFKRAAKGGENNTDTDEPKKGFSIFIKAPEPIIANIWEE